MPMPMPTPTPPAVSRLFVYGTLMPRRLRWPILAPFAQSHRMATVAGTIYDSGCGWPVAVFANGDAVVPGVLVDLDPWRLTEALAILDDVEETATDKLRRIVVTTNDGATAWAYHHPQAVDGMTQIDRWHEAFDER